jgi:hypothetical protein
MDVRLALALHLCLCVGSGEAINWTCAHSPRPPIATQLDHLSDRYMLSRANNCCIYNTGTAHPRTNYCDVNTTSPGLTGTTHLINEWMAPGHVPYDLVLMDVLHMVKVDRILIRLASCSRIDQCSNWKSFFEDYYRLLIVSARSFHTKVYLRNYPENTTWSAMQVTPDPPYDFFLTGETIAVPRHGDPLCFDHIVMRKDYDNEGFREGISLDAISAFKKAAAHYSVKPEILFPSLDNVDYFHKVFVRPYNKRKPIICFSYRGSRASRHMSNAQDFMHNISWAFPTSNVLFLGVVYIHLDSML